MFAYSIGDSCLTPGQQKKSCSVTGSARLILTRLQRYRFILELLKVLPVLPWSYPCFFAEQRMEKLHIQIADLIGDLVDRDVGGLEQLAAFLDADVLQILCERKSGRFFEQPLEMARAQIEVVGHMLHRNILRIIAADEMNDLLEPAERGGFCLVFQCKALQYDQHLHEHCRQDRFEAGIALQIFPVHRLEHAGERVVFVLKMQPALVR